MSGNDLIHFRVTGTVQGVFFRQSTKEEANKLGVRGWVRNNPDDSVEGVAVGPSDKIKHFKAFINKGPSHAQVDNVELKTEKSGASEQEVSEALRGAKGFEIRRH